MKRSWCASYISYPARYAWTIRLTRARLFLRIMHQARFEKIKAESQAKQESTEAGRIAFISQVRENYHAPLILQQQQDLQLANKARGKLYMKLHPKMDHRVHHYEPAGIGANDAR